MTKVVIPPPSQPLVADEDINAPWRQYFDVLNLTVNSLTTLLEALTTVVANAPQLISVTPVTAGSTRYNLAFASSYRRVRLNLSGLVPGTTDTVVTIRLSTDGGATSISSGYRYATHVINDSTGASIFGSTNTSDFPLTVSNVSTASTGGLAAEFHLMSLTTPRVSALYRGVYLNGATSPELNILSGGGRLDGISGAPINGIVVRTSTGSFTTGSITLYGDR